MKGYKPVTQLLLCLCISILCNGYAQSSEHISGSIQGRVQLDSIWSKKIFLSAIDSFDELYTMSNSMIIAESVIDEEGFFNFDVSYLPKEDRLYRLHISKKNGPVASLIIGGEEENHLFLIANATSHVFLTIKKGTGLANYEIEGYAPALSLA